MQNYKIKMKNDNTKLKNVKLLHLLKLPSLIVILNFDLHFQFSIIPHFPLPANLDKIINIC